jgi:Resolvase, N terminal domain
MRVGYARVSTPGQPPDMQLQAPTTAECEKIYGERASGDRADRPKLAPVPDNVLCDNHSLVVCKLGRRAHPLKQLTATAEKLQGRNIGAVLEAPDPARGKNFPFVVFREVRLCRPLHQRQAMHRARSVIRKLVNVNRTTCPAVTAHVLDARAWASKEVDTYAPTADTTIMITTKA